MLTHYAENDMNDNRSPRHAIIHIISLSLRAIIHGSPLSYAVACTTTVSFNERLNEMIEVILPPPADGERYALIAAQNDSTLVETNDNCRQAISDANWYMKRPDHVMGYVQYHIDQFHITGRLYHIDYAACYLTAYGY